MIWDSQGTPILIAFLKNNTVLRLPNIGKTASYDQNEDPFFVNWNRSTKYPILSFMKSIVLKILDFVFKALVGGFTTVTIASVVFAGIIVPMIF